ncbi:Aste57867_19116 [Aphanomyces stellatus]|uniref:Aste57867_19116 protein n=1 Tax=Aphanomyces stellatus TaxID=120398 RepID=A0A485LDS8_9STRA|nr:hypothetical protein As57867_019052 [Aphanomyces stellatus]VFT95840.1 Aste57867_19116 [Aphanomyces stellatus]
MTRTMAGAPPPETLLGILGGVGPAAGLVLHQAILRHTQNDGTDQGHLDVVHVSRSADIAARPTYLHQHADDAITIENPAYGMARSLKMLIHAAKSRQAKLVVGVPCNTFHAPPIWDTFVAAIDQVDPSAHVVLLHMLQETVRMVAEIAPAARVVGVMSTTGSRDARIFHNLLEPLGYTVVQVPASLQEELNDTIYNTEWGIKSTAPTIHPRAVANFEGYARLLARDYGAQVAILGCTEIPMALPGSEVDGMVLVDPMVALARAMIREVDAAKLVPLDMRLLPTMMSRVGKPKRTLSVRSDENDTEVLDEFDSDDDDEDGSALVDVDALRFCFY